MSLNNQHNFKCCFWIHRTNTLYLKEQIFLCTSLTPPLPIPTVLNLFFTTILVLFKQYPVHVFISMGVTALAPLVTFLHLFVHPESFTQRAAGLCTSGWLKHCLLYFIRTSPGLEQVIRSGTFPQKVIQFRSFCVSKRRVWRSAHCRSFNAM